MSRSFGTALATITLLAFVGTSSLSAQEAAAKKKSANILKQLALAVFNYHDVHLCFPPATTYSKDGKPLYSWRVAILPFIEQDNLYKEFKLDEPWDSEHNKPLLDKMPKLFAPVTGKPKEKNTTHYQVFVGEGAVFEDKKKITFTSVTDGTSNTIMIVEAEEPVPWSKPADLTYDPKKPLPKCGGLFKDGFHAAFVDGQVRFIKKDVDAELMHLLIQRNDGKPVDLRKLK